MSQYPQQNVPEFLALASEMERVKKLEGGTAFITDLIEAVVATQGLVVVDKGEYDGQRAAIVDLVDRCNAVDLWHQNWDLPFADDDEWRGDQKLWRDARIAAIAAVTSKSDLGQEADLRSRRRNSRSTASRMRSDRFSPSSSTASIRASVPSGNLAGVASWLICLRPIVDITY